MGDGVNIAARLEGICEPGAIAFRGRLSSGEGLISRSGNFAR
jgi:class 3 adenylate cyclase